MGFKPAILGDLRLRNTCAIGCAKKTAENVFFEGQVWIHFVLQ